MILLFIGGMVAGACGGFFALGMVPAARCADCKDRRNRLEEERWPDGNYYAWDNTVGVRKAKEDLRALARKEGRLFAPKSWPAT